MQTVRFYSQADENGKLQLQLDHLPVNENLEIVVVYQPVSSHITAPSNQDEDPIVGLFSDDSNFAEDSEKILEQGIHPSSLWTWKSWQIQGLLLL